ncbi:MAG: hypothetical protein OEZ10_12535 [Gammaproteobacteria bacterium]|nr:hypothetical protein [Gammaproteobacteria bacterium]
MTVAYYSQKMLNPFRGVMQVVETDGADAASIDGVHWDLYVDDLDTLHDACRRGYDDVSVPDIKFGSWSHEHGLLRAPLIPTRNLDAVQQAGEALLDMVRKLESRVPFPAGDDLELWLLDDQGMPVVLIDSCPVYAENTTVENPRWLIGQRCRQQFRSQSANGTPCAEWLEQRINAQAGSPGRAQWFLRSESGACALDGVALDRRWYERQLPASAFPELTLKTDWNEPQLRNRASEYIAWLSPFLLQLPHLSDHCRSRLERSAWLQPGQVNRLQPMYPRVIDVDGLRATLVRARIEQANTFETDRSEEVIPPYYIEL